MKGSIAGVGLALALGAAQPASAALIDFTDGLWSPADPVNQSVTRNYSGIDVTLQAFDEDNNFTSFTQTDFDGDTTKCAGTGLACDIDGVGIGDDEVTFGVGMKTDVERLMVTFSREVDIAAIFFLDLFGEESSTDTPAEVVQFQINGDGGPGGTFTGSASDTTGLFVGSMPSIFNGVTSIEFFADTFKTSSPDNTDFSLAGIKTVPEPGTLALLSLGLLGLGAARRRGSRA